MNETGKNISAGKQKELGVPLTLITCLLLVGFWEIMSNRIQRPFRPFDLTAENFKGFSPAVEGWSFQSVPVTSNPIEPNIFAIKVVPVSSLAPHSHASIMVRLVHGYNMPDCMRIKGYKVELIEDRRGTSEKELKQSINTNRHRWNTSESTTQQLNNSFHRDQASGSNQRFSCQVWRLTSGSDDVSIWVTSTLKAGDFSVTDIDVRSMPFPRIGVPDDPGWFPRGLTMSGLRHPIDGFRLFLRAKWNSSRCDLLTFLRLKTPAWADNELLTLVSTSEGIPVKSGQEKIIIGQVIVAHKLIQSQLGLLKSDR